MNNKLLYLHGFASGPLSTKAQFFKKKSIGKVEFDIYDYIPDQDSFTNLKTSSILKKLHSYTEIKFSEGVILCGSSFGGLLSLWYAASHPKNVIKLILIAPALRFSASSITKLLEITPNEWETTGFAHLMHYRYNQMVPLAYSFYTDILNNPPPDFYRMNISIPTTIIHDIKDEVVPISWSREYLESKTNVILHELEGDHQLLDQKEIIWSIITKFLD